jgi:hypothetical protein
LKTKSKTYFLGELYRIILDYEFQQELWNP